MEKSAAFPEAGVGVVRGPGFPEVQGPGPRKEPLGKVDQAMGAAGRNKGPEMATPFLGLTQGLGNGLAQRVFTPPELQRQTSPSSLWE